MHYCTIFYLMPTMLLYHITVSKVLNVYVKMGPNHGHCEVRMLCQQGTMIKSFGSGQVQKVQNLIEDDQKGQNKRNNSDQNKNDSDRNRMNGDKKNTEQSYQNSGGVAILEYDQKALEVCYQNKVSLSIAQELLNNQKYPWVDRYTTVRSVNFFGPNLAKTDLLILGPQMEEEEEKTERVQIRVTINIKIGIQYSILAYCTKKVISYNKHRVFYSILPKVYCTTMVIFFHNNGWGYETKSLMVEIQILGEMDGCEDGKFGKLYIDMTVNGKWKMDTIQIADFVAIIQSENRYLKLGFEGMQNTKRSHNY